jgi:large subunit ribosomal protein L9
MAVTEVILKENIPGLGAEADIVKVRKGYSRNYLVPTGKAYEVTPANLKRLTILKAKRAEREAHELNEAEEAAARIDKVRLSFELETGETGKAFGSVTAKDIEDKLKAEAGIEIDRHKIQLERPIKETGEQEIRIRLYGDVTATLKVDVRAKASQAPEQASTEAEAKSRPRRKPRTTSA